MNKVILMGRLVKDPELRYTSANNTAVCSFSLAVNKRFSKPGEEKQAEFCGKWFEKGRQVVVVGRLQNRSWDDNEGKKHYVTEVVAEETYFADSKKSEGAAAPAQRPAGGSAPAGQSDGFYPLDEDDDLPF